MMRWYPDRTPDPRPIHGWGERLDPSVVADVTFQEQDDPEGAHAWLDARLNEVEPDPADQIRSELDRLAQSVPFPPENVRPPEGWRMTNPREDPRMRNDYYVRAVPMSEGQRTIYDHERTVRDSRDELADRTRRVYPAGCFQDPPTTQPVERPDFPRGEMTGIESVTMIFRMNNGWEETYVIENPADLQFQTVVEQEWIEVGELQRRVIPGIRELRQIMISIGSPRNWRRLPSRRWQ
jgi:hypothetical protein